MRLHLIRHASAEAAGEGGDAARRLSDRGRREALEAGRALRELGDPIGAILTSPLARARETAEQIAAAFNPPLPVEVRETLACGASPQALLETARAYPAGEVVLVGHMPDLGVLVAALTGESMSFRPSSICCLDLASDSTRLVWVRHPA